MQIVCGVGFGNLGNRILFGDELGFDRNTLVALSVAFDEDVLALVFARCFRSHSVSVVLISVIISDVIWSLADSFLKYRMIIPHFFLN